MFDLTDITNVVKKTTKTATDLTMKPIQFVTAPLVDMHNKLRKSVFGPDLIFLTEVQQKEQYTILMEAYGHHCEKIKLQLQKDDLPAKKIDAFMNAIELISAAHESIIEPQAKIEAMQNLFDELRSLCKEYIPTVLKEETFSSPKKITTTEDEFKIIAKAINTSKIFLQYCASEIEDNSSLIACNGLPGTQSLKNAIEKTKITLPENQKNYQDDLFALQKVIHDGYDLINSIRQSTLKIRAFENNKNSVYGPQKTKLQKTSEGELNGLKKHISHDFQNRKKGIVNAQNKTKKSQKELFSIIPECENNWISWFEDYKRQVITHEKQVIITKKQYNTFSSKITKTIQQEQNSLIKCYGLLTKALKSPFDNYTELNNNYILFINQYNEIHETYHQSAHNNWTSSLISEMPLLLTQLSLGERKSYLMEKLSFQRQQLFHAKLLKRLWKGIISEVQGYENIIDDHKIDAKEILTSVLEYLRTLTNQFQDEMKLLDIQIANDDSSIESIKTEIWDTIPLDRLIMTKRTLQNDLLWSKIASEHKKQLNDELIIHQKEIKSFQLLFKEVEKKHRIDVTAFREHKKTVQIVKTKEQLEKLDILKVQIANQEKVINKLHETILLITTHCNELIPLIKKYGTFANNNEKHAQLMKKNSNELAKKTNKGSLKNLYDCTEKTISVIE